MKNNVTTLFAVLMILAATLLRIANIELGMFHLVPMAAISLFSGAVLKNKSLAIGVPMIAMFISDLFLQFTQGAGFYGVAQLFVYGALVLVSILGTTMKDLKTSKILGYSLGGSLLFWVISNLGVFAGGWYGYSFSGLMATFAMALPFLENEMATNLFVNSFVSDILGSSILFGSYALVAKTQIKKSIA